MKLNVLAFGVAGGIIWGLGVFLAAWWIMVVGTTGGEASFLERIYVGYAFTPLGSVIGLIWGLVDGFVACAVFAWLYNLLAARLTAA